MRFREGTIRPIRIDGETRPRVVARRVESRYRTTRGIARDASYAAFPLEKPRYGRTRARERGVTHLLK